MEKIRKIWEFPRELDQLQVIRDRLSDFMESLGVSEAKKNKMILCIDEAAANVVKYSAEGPPPNPPLVFRVEAAFDGQMIRVLFVDEGKPFDPTDYPTVDLKKHIISGKKGGLGIHIMRKSLDLIHYEFKAGSNCFEVGIRHTQE